MKLNKILIVFILILIVPIMGCSNDEISNSNTNIHSNSKTLSSYSDEQYEEYKNQELEYESKEYEYDKENYSQTIYVGSEISDKYHIPECEWANKIHINNLIEFSSKEEAENRGYKPCRVCNP